MPPGPIDGGRDGARCGSRKCPQATRPAPEVGHLPLIAKRVDHEMPDTVTKRLPMTTAAKVSQKDSQVTESGEPMRQSSRWSLTRGSTPSE